MKKANMHVSIWASSLSRFDSAWSSLVTFYTVFGSKGKRVGPCGLLIWAGDERGENRDGIVCAFTWAASFPGCALWIPLGPSWQAIIGRQMSFPADAYNKPITDADVYGCYVRSTSIHPSGFRIRRQEIQSQQTDCVRIQSMCNVADLYM